MCVFADIAGHPFPVGLDDGGGGGSDLRRATGEDSAEPVDGSDGGAEDGEKERVALLAVLSAQAFGIDLHFSQYVMLALATTVVALGTAPVPSASLFMLAAVLQVIGIGAEQTALVVGFILPNIDWAFTQPEPLEGVGLWTSVSIGFAILASSPLSFSNSADLARYLPRETKPSHIVAATALG